MLAGTAVALLAVAAFAAATIGFLALLAALSSWGTSWLAGKSAADARALTSKLFVATTVVYAGVVATAMLARRRGKEDGSVAADEPGEGERA